MLAYLKAARWAIVAALLAGVTSGGVGVWYGWSERGEKEEIKAAAQLRRTVKIEADLGDELALEISKRLRAKEDLDAANQKYRNALASGALRLSVPITRSVPDGTAAGAGHPEARAELEPAAAVRIDAIGTDGDAAVRDLNACIDQYETVRKAVNGAKNGN